MGPRLAHPNRSLIVPRFFAGSAVSHNQGMKSAVAIPIILVVLVLAAYIGWTVLRHYSDEAIIRTMYSSGGPVSLSLNGDEADVIWGNGTKHDHLRRYNDGWHVESETTDHLGGF